jgi:hypothetical protein
LLFKWGLEIAIDNVFEIIIDILISPLQVIGNQLSQYGSSTFYKGLIFKIPTSVKSESVDNKNAIKTNDGFFENEEKHHAER